MEEVLELVRESSPGWALLVVFVAAALEYVVPPLPADTVLLAGSLLVVAGSVSFPVVYAVAVAGGALGALAHYQIGRWLADEEGRLRSARWVERLIGAHAMPRFLAAFRRYGLWAIVLNRAFPGVRAVTFLAAGAARLRLLPVMVAGLVSNLAWTFLILSVGVRVGSDWEKIVTTFEVYQRAILTGGGAVLVLFAAVKLWQRLRRA